MNNVRMVKLGDLCEINPRAPKLTDETLISFVSMSDLSSSKARTISETSRPYHEVKKSYTGFQDQDILIAKITPCWENIKIGIANIKNNFGFGSTEFHVIRASDEVTRRYLLHFLRNTHVNLQGKLRMTGSGGQKRVPAKFFEDLQVPLPSLEEQKRIVSILDKAKSIQEARERQLAALDELASSLFISTFPKEGKYNIFKLSEVAKTTSGGTPSRKNPENYGGDILWVKSGELQTRYITDSEEKITEVGMTSSSAKIMPAGTILFAMYGATAGAVAKLGVPAATNQAVCCITPNHSLITDTYLMSYLKFRKSDLINMRTGGAQPNLSQSLIRNLDISLPPLEVQKIFSEKIKIIESRRSLIHQAAKTGNEFFTSVQNILFDH